jgi:hypothetical protein
MVTKKYKYLTRWKLSSGGIGKDKENGSGWQDEREDYYYKNKIKK